MYVKLFTSLYQGTLRGKSDDILVFTNLLAHCDRNGIVDKHWNAIAQEVGISEKRVKEAIKRLEDKDVDSRTQDNEGRRIIRLDGHRAWGWQVTNYAKYRAMRNEEDRREQNRESQARFRNKPKVSHSKPSISQVSRGNPMQKQMQKQLKPPTPLAGGEREEIVISIYELYPRQDAPSRSQASIRRALEKIDPDRLKGAVKRYASLPATQREGGRFVPPARKWFDNECWRDHLPKKSKTAADIPLLPSKALEDVRYMLGRSKQIVGQELEMTLAFIGKMTIEDWTMLSAEENKRIKSIQGRSK